MFNNIKILIFILFIFLVKIQRATTQGDIKSTDYKCAGSNFDLECEKNTMIIISKIVFKYSPSQCINLLETNVPKSISSTPLDHCVSVDRFDLALNRNCNGKMKCNGKIEKKTHNITENDVNCNFTSNIANIFYKCIPADVSSKIESFDICDPVGPDVISGLKQGYIHSPSYPEYYGNNKLCIVNLDVPKGQRLEIYMITKSLESLSLNKQTPVDYVIIDNEFELYGYSHIPHLIYEGADKDKVEIKFKSDFITTADLALPKGFLIYFQISPIKSPIVKLEIVKSEKDTFIHRDSTVGLKGEHQNLLSHDENVSNNSNDEMAGVIGFLLLILIVPLLVAKRNLFLQRKNQVSNTEERPVSIRYYNNDTQNGSLLSNNSSSKSILSNVSNENKIKPNSGKKYIVKLQKFNKDMNMSQLSGEKNEKDLSEESFSNLIRKQQTSSRNINEFNQNNESNIKAEKEISIGRLKLFKSTMSSKFKKSNIDLEREQIEQQQLQNLHQQSEQAPKEDRAENFYVSNLIVAPTYDKIDEIKISDVKKIDEETNSQAEMYQSINDLNIASDQLSNKYLISLNETAQSQNDIVETSSVDITKPLIQTNKF